MYRENATSSSKAFIVAAKVYCPDAKLTQTRCAHHTRLYRDVQIRVFENTRWMLLQNLCDCDEFCMASALGVISVNVVLREE
jgi:hypothetical protein